LAKDYGVRGHVFPIGEEDLREYILKRIEALTQQERDRICQEIQSHYQKIFLHPMRVRGIRRAAAHAVHYFDPTVVAKEEVRDASRSIVIEKGASYNPLHHFSLPQEIVFFDGEDATQLQWARENHPNVIWILIAGSPIELETQEGRAIYFDQNGLLTKKLNIEAVPALISQEGSRLKIESVPVGEAVCTKS